MNDAEPTPVEEVITKSPFGELSIVDVFKQELNELKSAKDVYIPVKGYERTGLAVRYHLPESGKLLSDIGDRIFREVKDAYTRNLNITMDTMAFLADGLYVKHPDNPDEWVEFDPELTGAPIGFDDTLANLLAIEGGSARAVIKGLFGGNEVAIMSHGEKLQRWISDTKTDVNLEFWQTANF